MTDDIVLVDSYTSESEAQIFKGVLESAGITAEVYSDDLGGWYPNLQSSQGVRLMVRRDDLERAREVLDESSE
jgi:hypothetical protein